MRRIHAATILQTFIALASIAAPAFGQPAVAFPTPTASPPPPVGTPTFTAPPPASFPPPVAPSQPFPPFDPYAQPAQFTTPVAPPPPPPAALPYTAPPPPPTSIGFPSIVNVAGGFYASFEATVLEPHVGSSSAAVNVPPPVQLTFNSNWDLEFAPRAIAGYKGAGGLGVRGRWWYFDNSTNSNITAAVAMGTPVPIANVPTDLKVNSIDLEGTQDGQFNNWDFQVAGGVRYATIDYDLTANLTPLMLPDRIRASSDFSGVGPTIAVSGRRPLTAVDGLAFLANLRVAFLFGDTDVVFRRLAPAPAANLFTVTSQDLIQVWEAQVGVEYSREIQYGVRVFGGAFLEAQVWEWDEGFGIGGGDLGFFGPTAAIGIAR